MNSLVSSLSLRQHHLDFHLSFTSYSVNIEYRIKGWIRSSDCVDCIRLIVVFCDGTLQNGASLARCHYPATDGIFVTVERKPITLICRDHSSSSTHKLNTCLKRLKMMENLTKLSGKRQELDQKSGKY